MKKSTIAIALIVIFLLIVGSAIWLSLNKPSNTATNTDDAHNTTQTQTTSETTDATTKTSVDIAIRDMSYSPSRIKIKKGTTVTWTNEDTVGHNVVAGTPSSSGGLPTSHPLIGKGEKFSHKFDTVGTFNYLCTPHPFMKGVVEVVE